MIDAMSFWRKKPFDRIEAIAAADRHRARGSRRKAIAGYRKVLEVDPSDVTAHSKLAPLLAEAGQRGEALASFHLAAQGHVKTGFVDRAVSVYVQAATFFPYEAMLWEELGRLYLMRELRADAVKALLTGGRTLGKRSASRADGARLLGEALAIEPWHPEATLALAHLQAKVGQRSEAKALLTGLADRARGRDLRRARGALFRLSPTPANATRWIKAALGRR